MKCFFKTKILTHDMSTTFLKVKVQSKSKIKNDSKKKQKSATRNMMCCWI